jgi:hypothetical protein
LQSSSPGSTCGGSSMALQSGGVPPSLQLHTNDVGLQHGDLSVVGLSHEIDLAFDDMYG